MKRAVFGFTLVEILIAVTLLGIIASIGFVSWTNLSNNSRDKARINDINTWFQTFELYKGQFSVWPALPVDNSTPKLICLGAPYSENTSVNPNKRCGQYSGSSTVYRESVQTGSMTDDEPNYKALAAEVAKVGKVPTNTSPPITGISTPVAGPIVHLSRQTATDGSGNTIITVTGLFFGFFEGNCSGGMSDLKSSPALATFLAGIPSGSNKPNVCGLTKQLTYKQF